MAGALEHIRVVDMSRALAGPLTAQILADLGAEVIKVERPGSGDETRSWGPPFFGVDDDARARQSAYFLAVNRGKRSIELDLASESGQRVARELAARADVLIENYKVGTLARFGLAYEDLDALNPRLVYCSLTGFGQSGPRCAQSAYDFAIQAMGGLMSLTGRPDDEPGGGPLRLGVPIVDMTTGLYGAIAVLAALTRRSETGRGDHIDVGMFDVAVSTLLNHALSFLVSGSDPARIGNRHPSIQPHDVFPCRDGELALVIGNDEQFRRLGEVLDLRLDDDRFATNAARIANIAELRPLLADRFAARERSYWLERLGRANVPAAPINSVREVLADPQIEHRGMRFQLEHPRLGPVPQIASPMRFEESQVAPERPPPLLGEHTLEILGELGMDHAADEASVA